MATQTHNTTQKYTIVASVGHADNATGVDLDKTIATTPSDAASCARCKQNAHERYHWRPFSPLPENVERTSVPGCYLEAVLGNGGMGTVYLARQTNLDRQVAVKVLNQKVADNPQFISRLRQEAHIMGAMSHPNLVGCHDIIVTQNSASIVMEYIPGHLNGGNLVKLLGPMPEYYVVKVLLAIARALDYANERNIIHRDVKPENILFAFNRGRAPRNYDELFLAPELRIALCDFGIADARKELRAQNASEDGESQNVQVVGSPLYMAPEQAVTPDKIDFRVDIYALGATAYYLLTGHAPFQGDSWEEVINAKCQDGVPAPKGTMPRFNNDFAHLIKKMGALLPEARYDSYKTLIKELERIEVFYADRAMGIGAFVYGHQRSLMLIVSILLILLLGAYGSLKWYEHWLSAIEERLPRQVFVSENWSDSIRSWRLSFDISGDKQTLEGSTGSRLITLKQALHEDDYMRFELAVSGTGRCMMTIQAPSEDDKVLGRIVCSSQQNSAQIRLYSPDSDGGIAVPVPQSFPDQHRQDGWIELRLQFRYNYIAVWNRKQLLGVIHFNLRQHPEDMSFSVSAVPEDTHVKLRNVIIVPAKDARRMSRDL